MKLHMKTKHKNDDVLENLMIDNPMVDMDMVDMEEDMFAEFLLVKHVC